MIVPYSEEKLKNSLLRAGTEEKVIEKILPDIRKNLYPGISTGNIYKMAFRLLRKNSKNSASKYHLKGGIMELGPSGFPFERFVAELLKHQGYKTEIGLTVKGKCVNHEIDIEAQKGEHHFMVECKYHNLPGNVCDVKIPLYIEARFRDVEAEWINLPGHGTKFHQGWLVTNTRFTADAIQYGSCAGLKLIGWDYPEKESLRSTIDTFGLYPITILTSLTKAEKQKLLENKIVLCKEIVQQSKLLSSIGIKQVRIKKIIEDASGLCQTGFGNEK